MILIAFTVKSFEIFVHSNIYPCLDKRAAIRNGALFSKVHILCGENFGHYTPSADAVGIVSIHRRASATTPAGTFCPQALLAAASVFHRCAPVFCHFRIRGSSSIFCQRSWHQNCALWLRRGLRGHYALFKSRLIAVV